MGLQRKLDAAGKLSRYKVRLVCKGFMQGATVDNSKTFQPFANFASFTFVIAIVTSYKFRLVQLDVIMTFLNPNVEEEVYDVKGTVSFPILAIYVHGVTLGSNSDEVLEWIK